VLGTFFNINSRIRTSAIGLAIRSLIYYELNHTSTLALYAATSDILENLL